MDLSVFPKKITDQLFDTLKERDHIVDFEEKVDYEEQTLDSNNSDELKAVYDVLRDKIENEAWSFELSEKCEFSKEEIREMQENNNEIKNLVRSVED